MKTLLIATMLGSTAMTGAALAQETTAPDATMQTDPAMQTEGMEAGMDSQTQGEFITWQEQDQMIASNLMGANVWGAENEVIGNVDDLLLDRNGQVIAIIVGIGGFLGLGERDVAISDDQLEFVLAQDAAAGGGAPAEVTAPDAAMAPETGGMATDGTTVPAPTGTVVLDQTGEAGTAAPGVAPGVETTDAAGTGMADTAGTVGTAGTAGADMTSAEATGMAAGTGMTGAGWGWTGGTIDHIQVNFTREQLEAAPPFETVE